ncbi:MULTISPECIES: (d)CMP kinase [Sutcliffiella]|uniref:(d)CMP kinase n=1 Tax=Sutcliffiella cohnii TaxID=33932 RepID=A0A223KW48_9BACI|nr:MULTISPECIES: (d)CMP kinase [Sutcliffiella]AST93558.1 hypothetical protein BC6307_20955 [Sutcliffiella cohnii]WBL14746.1 (d)CMP kinase [Sutcliffiella sp. NC1]
MIITVDGTSGAGKSAFANELANSLGIKHISLGFIFRAIAWCLINDNSENKLSVSYTNNYNSYPTIMFDGKNITREIQGNLAIEKIVSSVGAQKRYEEIAYSIIKKHLGSESAVIEGRNTHGFFPNAILNIILDAKRDERFNRNRRELERTNKIKDIEEFLYYNKKRDENDQKRSVGSLQVTEDMFYIDTTNTSLEENVKMVMDKIECIEKRERILASVIIPAYNRSNHLKECLHYLEKQNISSVKYEIIVVDDQSTDDTREVVATFPGVRYIQNNGKRGPGSARNKGVAIARGEVIIFLDSDILVQEDFILTHIDYHNKSSRTVVLGARRHLPEHIDYIPKNKIKMESREVLISKYSQDINYLMHPWSLCYTCIVSLPSFLAKSTTFNEDFKGWGMEDIEWGYRLHNNNVRWLFSNRSIGYHLYHDRNMNDKKFNQWKLNLEHFLQLHRGEDAKKFEMFSSVFDPNIKANYMEIYEEFNPREEYGEVKILNIQNDANDNFFNYIQKKFLLIKEEVELVILVVPSHHLNTILIYSQFLNNIIPFIVFTVNQWEENKETILESIKNKINIQW